MVICVEWTLILLVLIFFVLLSTWVDKLGFIVGIGTEADTYDFRPKRTLVDYLLLIRCWYLTLDSFGSSVVAVEEVQGFKAAARIARNPVSTCLFRVVSS